jgi:hypothetical protein
MHPRQASLLSQAQEITSRIAAKKKPTAVGGAPVLWKYTCPETSKDFYLPERKTTTRSPYTGKSFTAKPEKLQMSGVGKELKEDAKAAK